MCILASLGFISTNGNAQTLTGRVYKGTTGIEPPISKPIVYVTLKLYGSNDANTIGTSVISTTMTDSNGWYSLPVRGAFDFYNIIEENPAGYISDGATSVSGTVKSADWIQYSYDQLSQTTTGNKFWDKPRAPANNPPVADADGPYTGTVNQPVYFDGSGSYDPDAGDSITSYEWDLDNDGQFDDATGKYPSWTWNVPTAQSIHLKVTDTHGATGTDSSYVTIEAQLEFDYGDAPDPSYPTLASSNGARHQIDPDVFLGNKIDPDEDGQPNSDATGDDKGNIDDEDGIVFKGAFIPGNWTRFEATVSRDGFLGVWVDFNGNGSWADPGESLFISDTLVFKGLNNWSIYVPANAKLGKTFARFRFSTKSGMKYNGTWQDGEVEDYQVTIEAPKYDYGDAPDPFYPTLLTSNGARHQIDPNVYMGSSIDSEPDGQPNADATGDDIDGNDDDDGVVFKDAFIPGSYARFDVTVSVDGYLGIWIDFNGNGSWADPGESVFIVDTMVFAGVNTWGVSVPAQAKLGKTFARFRFSRTYGLTFDGLRSDGEVEDYQVTIGSEQQFGSIGDWVWHDLNQNGLQDAGEPGLDSVQVSLYDHNGNMLASTQTTLTGFYTFSNITPGSYFIKFNLRPGFAYSPPDQGMDDTIDSDAQYGTGNTPLFTLAAGEHNTTIDAGMYRDEGSDELDFGDAPDPNYPTLLSSNGARHVIRPGFFLGFAIDPEPNGFPTHLSDGDDTNNINDEDGVTMSPFIAPGQSVPITVTASDSGALNAWIDFNCDGDWADAGEHFIPAMPVHPGTNSFTMNVPGSAQFGHTYARFRFSSIRQLSYEGLAPDGEVEDYAVEIVEGDDGSITIFKDANPKDNTQFTICAQFSSSFFNILCVNLLDPLSNRWTILNPYQVDAVMETIVPGWTLTDITVTGDTDNGSTIDVTAMKVVVDYDPGENIVIIFKNEKTGEDEYDFGDAPDPRYPTRLANNGARHIIKPNFYLGSGIDAEQDGIPTVKADGDNNNGIDDEDGVSMFPFIAPGSSIPFTVIASASGVLNAWLDFNINGSWADPGEHFIAAQPVMPGANLFVLNVPANATLGQSYARFRFSSVRNISYDGVAPDGEVEDYAVVIQKGEGGSLTIVKDALPKDNTPFWISTTYGVMGGAAPFRDPLSNTATMPNGPIGNYYLGESVPAGWTLGDIVITGDADNGSVVNLGAASATIDLDAGEKITVTFKNEKTGGEERYDFGDAPDDPQNPGYPTLHANGGAYHTIVDGFHLGALIDAELNGQPAPDALGDDQMNLDDEDGVSFPTPLIPGQQAIVEVVASSNGILNAWIDYNANSSWMESGEHVFIDIPISAGNNPLTFNVPATAVLGITFARFRLSRIPGMMATGYGRAGEVEDYEVGIKEGGEGPPTKWRQIPLVNKDPDMPYTPYFFGWDVRSTYDGTYVADDWFCKSPRPVTEIQWWGSYTEWDSAFPPPIAPHAFHIGVWTDVPKGEDADWSHPGKMIWEWVVAREMTHEHVVGNDFHPEYMSKPDTCFRYDFVIPQDQWFHQESDSTIYWLSISALYEDAPDSFAWGWKTREHFFHDDAVYVYDPSMPTIGAVTTKTEPIDEGWDLAFVLITNEKFLEFDFGDAPFERYPTYVGQNGAHHIYDPNVFLGQYIDTEETGQPDQTCTGDDNDGMDDDDGIKFFITTGDSATYVEVTASRSGYLNAWMDFDNNGSWAEPEDQIFQDEFITGGQSILKVQIPDDAVAPPIFSRFRFSTEPGLSFIGIAIDGEVEDYLFDIVPVGVEQQEAAIIPTEFRLYQNYPNPFNPETIIRFDLPVNNGSLYHVNLSIYNIRGQLIRTLVDEHKSRGAFTVKWDRRDNSGQKVNSGIYLLKIIAGDYRAGRKMIILK